MANIGTGRIGSPSVVADEIRSHPYPRLPLPWTRSLPLHAWSAFEFDRHKLELRKQGLKMRVSGLGQAPSIPLGNRGNIRECV